MHTTKHPSTSASGFYYALVSGGGSPHALKRSSQEAWSRKCEGVLVPPNEAWERRSAEELLHRCARRCAVDAPPAELPEEAATTSAGPARSSSAPSLRPLPAPQQSPFAKTLSALTREPREFVLQRDLEARREARKLLRSSYRSSVEGIGCRISKVPDPWPPKMEPVVEAGLARPRAVYGPAPLAPELLPLTKFGALKPTHLVLEEAGDSASTPAARRRKEGLQKLAAFGRSSHGAPYTLGQICSEMEANIQHRRAHDSRALSGSMGPLQLGTGSTRSRRALLFSEGSDSGFHMRNNDSEPVLCLKD